MSKPYKHQKHMAEFWNEHPRMFNTSDPGTGKTRGAIDGFVACGMDQKKLLVVAPLSILSPSWADDIEKFAPQLKWGIAHGSKNKREKVFNDPTLDVVITNHDGVKWVVREDLSSFTHLVIDESTAFKNRGTERARAALQIANSIEYAQLMTGTPNSNTVTDLWHQVFMLDGGARLGDSFFGFRSQCCYPEPIPGKPVFNWKDKEGIEVEVGALIHDITLRYAFEECMDIPENVTHVVRTEMPTWLRETVSDFQRERVLEDTEVVALHAGVLAKKILQMLSGAVYDTSGNPTRVHEDRYKLIVELMREREHCVVAYNWRHELDALLELCRKEKWPVAYINSDISPEGRANIVRDFQAGKLKAIFAHPQSASHGLTLTRGTSTIWCSPTYNAELYKQFNHRIYRAGQTRKTETICVAYDGSKEDEVYAKLGGKLDSMTDLLDLFIETRRAA